MASIIKKMLAGKASPTKLRRKLKKEITIPPLSRQDSIVLWQPENTEEDFNRNYLKKKQLGSGGFGTAWLVIGREGFNKDKAFVAKFNQKASRG